MASSRELIVADPLSPQTKRLAQALGRPFAGEILASLYEKPYQSASDIARVLDIHVATAQKYLQELKECGVLGTRPRKGVSRPTEEYWVASPRISIDIDFDRLTTREDAEARANQMFVREASGSTAVFESDPKGERITEVLLLEDGERRRIATRMPLGEAEGRFLYQVPPSGQAARSVLDIATRANLPKTSLADCLDLCERLATVRAGKRDARLLDVEHRNGKVTA